MVCGTNESAVGQGCGRNIYSLMQRAGDMGLLIFFRCSTRRDVMRDCCMLLSVQSTPVKLGMHASNRADWSKNSSVHFVPHRLCLI